MDRLLDHLASWKPFRAAVIGDFMLDQLVYGDAERLSADAPVPILHVRDVQSRPGGAANVCLDLAALRGEVRCFGVIGGDGHGESLASELTARGIRADGLIRVEGRPTTLKQNLIGMAQSRHPQKMFRVDFEARSPIPGHVAEQLVRSLESSLAECDVVCIEDYAKGVCTEELCRGVIDAARRAGTPVMVDPARISDYSRYRGATVITPNRTEAEFATGMSACGEATLDRNEPLGRRLLADLDLEAVVLTLDRHGAMLALRGGEAVTVPTIARHVYDVTGAGDMFLAGLAASRSNGCSWLDAVRFANAAAGLEVEVFGVEPIPLDRIHHALMTRSAADHGKTRTLDRVLVEVAAARKAGRKVVFTNGCFDVLHAGHVSLLERAAAEGDVLIVGLNDDASVRRLKGPDRPVNNQEDRARVIGALGSVSAVVLFGEQTPMRLIEAIRPDVLVKGGDYRKELVVGASLVESYGGRVVLTDLVEGRSTSGTIRKMRGTSPASGPIAPS